MNYTGNHLTVSALMRWNFVKLEIVEGHYEVIVIKMWCVTILNQFPQFLPRNILRVDYLLCVVFGIYKKYFICASSCLRSCEQKKKGT